MGKGMSRAFQTKGPHIHPSGYDMWGTGSKVGNDRLYGWKLSFKPVSLECQPGCLELI